MKSLAAGLGLLVLLAGCAGDATEEPDDLVVEETSAAPTTGATPSTMGPAPPTTAGGPQPSNGTTSPPPGPAQNTPPQASLDADAASVPAGGSVTFTVEASDEDGDALTWTLDFGDGATESGESLPAEVAHTFAQVGDFTVTLTVSDGTDSAEASVAVEVVEAGPAYCEVDDEVSVGDLFYVHDRGTSGGVWLYEESNDVPGLQLSADASATGEADPLGAGCPEGDTLIF